MRACPAPSWCPRLKRALLEAVLEPGDRVYLEGNNQKHADPKPPRRPRDSSVEARTAVSPARSALALDALSWNTRASPGEGVELQR
jgi:hypothetical protein